MNSSPGGIIGIFVHKKFFESELPNLIGCWSNKAETRFEMRFQLDKEKGAAAFCVSNPPQLLLAVNYASLEVSNIFFKMENQHIFCDLFWNILIYRFFMMLEWIE